MSFPFPEYLDSYKVKRLRLCAIFLTAVDFLNLIFEILTVENAAVKFKF